MATELKDEDVFELSDEEVFEPASPSLELSDDDVFGGFQSQDFSQSPFEESQEVFGGPVPLDRPQPELTQPPNEKAQLSNYFLGRGNESLGYALANPLESIERGGAALLNLLSMHTPLKAAGLVDTPPPFESGRPIVPITPVSMEDAAFDNPNLYPEAQAFANRVGEFVSGLTTPGNIALAGGAAGSGVATQVGKSLAVPFGTKMLSEEVPAALGKASVVLQNPNRAPGEAGEAVADVVAPAALGAALIKSAAGGKSKPATERTPDAKPKAEAKETVLKEVKADPLESMSVEQQGKLGHRDGIEYGVKLTEADVPQLEAKYNSANSEMKTAFESGDNARVLAAFGKNNFYGGALQGATKGKHKAAAGNYELYLKQGEAAAKPAEATAVADQPAGIIANARLAADRPIQEPYSDKHSVSLQVAATEFPTGAKESVISSLPKELQGSVDSVRLFKGEIVPTNKAASVPARVEITFKNKSDAQSAIDFFKATPEPAGVSFLDRASEAEGLGRPSTMPTVADVRTQRTADAPPPIDPATGKPTGVGEADKMRRFSERGTVAEMVPEAVQEQIKTAPESFYTPQKVSDVKTQVRQMPDADLAAVPKESNIKTAAVVEQVKRLFESGKNDQGYSVFQEWSAELTRMGQVVNQAKLLTELQPEHLVNVVNKDLRAGGYDPLTKPQETRVLDVSKKKEAAQRELDKATDAWVKEPTDANAKLAEQAYKAAEDTALNVQRELNKYKIKSWPKMLKAFAQGNPLTPISQVANIVGNTLGAAMESGSRTIGAQMDVIRSALTGGERKLAVSPVRGTAEAAKGFGRGLSKAPGIMAKGAGETIKGETRAQLQPLKAWSRAFAKSPDVPTKGGKVPFNDRAKSAVEAVFGLPPEIMLRLLSAADKPAYESAFARLVNEQAKLQKLPSSDFAMAQKFPELFFDQKTLKRIQADASDAIFQRESKTVSYLNSLIKEKTGDWGDFAFTLLVAPYRLTPWNLVGRTLMYNPLIAAARVGIDAAKGNTRAAEIDAGRMVVGGLLYTAGYFLYKNQLIGPSLDDRDETQKARLLSGEVLPPNHVNIDGLKRLTRGGDPKYRAGDETMDLTRGGGAAGSILSTVANIGRDFEKKPETGEMEFVGSLLQNSTLEQASFTVNQSFLKGVTGVLDAVRNRNIQPYIDSVENMLLNVPTPNTLSSLSRASRKYMPDLSADAIAERFENIARNRFGVAGYDDYLPTKRDLWGEKMEQTPEGRNALLYHLFDISKNKQVTDDPVPLELYDLWRRTADNSVIPSIPTRTVTVENKSYPLNSEQYEKLAEQVGKTRRLIVDRLVINANWQDLPDEGKIKILESAYRKGAEFGRAKVVREIFDDLKEKPSKAGFSQ